MVSTLSLIKNNFMLKVFGDSYRASEATEFMHHNSKFKDALSDIKYGDHCKKSEFISYLKDIELNQDSSCKAENILKVIKLEDNNDLKNNLVLDFCEIASNLVNKSITVIPLKVQEKSLCSTFSPYRPIGEDHSKFAELVKHPKIEVTQELFIELANNLTITSLHYLDLILEYSYINGFFIMLALCPKVVLALGFYQGSYFIKNQLTSPESLNSFLIKLKENFIKANTLITRFSFYIIPNLYFCYGFLSSGLLGGTFYLFSVRNAQTGYIFNLLTKIPQLDAFDGIQNKYKLPSLLVPIKTFFTANILPVIYHSSSISSEVTKAAFLGCLGEKNILMIQEYINSKLSSYKK